MAKIQKRIVSAETIPGGRVFVMMPLSRAQPVGEDCFSSKCVKLKYVVGFRISIVFV